MADPEPANVLRHAARERPFEAAGGGDPARTEAVEAHIQRYFGPVPTVWHEIASHLVHIDVHVVEPTAERPYLTLVTSGMSERPMTVSPGQSGNRYAELMLGLPPDWPLSPDAIQDERAYWPIRLLKSIARLPHEYETWIAQWHSIPHGDPATPYADGVPFTGVLVAPMLRCPPEAREIVTPAGERISLLALIPLHQAEMDLKVASGGNALLDAFDTARVTELLDPGRPSSV